jgi:Protein  of unknown function (DUF3018)
MDTSTPAQRMAASRQKYKKQGLRLVSIWIPDTKNPDFAKLVREQCLMLKSDPQEREINEWLEEVADCAGWEG